MAAVHTTPFRPKATAFHFEGRAYYVDFVRITPAIADAMLATNTKNRKLSKWNVDRFSESLKRGEWMVNGEPIIFDEDGILISGQHRLTAVKMSGISMPTLIVTGVARDAFGTIDNVKPRGASDAMHVGGEKNTAVLAAAVRGILWAESGTQAAKRITNAQALATLAKHPSLREWVRRFQASSGTRAILPSAFCGLVTLCSERHGMSAMESFWDQVNTGEGLRKGMPALTLREKFAVRGRGVQIEQGVGMAFMIKAINAHLTGQSLSVLRMNADEAFPVLL